MKYNKKKLTVLLFWIAVTGNIVFILWILFNGMNEGFSGTLPEIFSALGLIILLAINTILLFRYRRTWF